MQTFLYLILFAAAFNLLLYLPITFRHLFVRRQRRLHEARADIATCVTTFQKHLANKDIVCGQLVHDFHYELINSAQYFEDYIAIWPLLTHRRKEIRVIRKQVKAELGRLPPAIKDLSDSFNSAYLRAAFYRHPIRFKILVLIFATNMAVRILRQIVIEESESWRYARHRFQLLAAHWRDLDARTPLYAFASLWFIAIGVHTFEDSSTPHQKSHKAILVNR